MKRRKVKHDPHILTALRAAAARRQKGLCYWCHEPMLSITADHLIPLHAGGQTRPGNIVASCPECNHHRHPKLNKAKYLRKLTIGSDKHYSAFEALRRKFESP